MPAPGIPGAITTTHHASHTTAAHHGLGYGLGMGGMGYGIGAYPGVVKHTETVSSAGIGGYPATAALSPYGGYSSYPGIAGLGFGAYSGYPAAKQVTQVTTTAVRPGGIYGYF